MKKEKILVAFGTRPEAIKMAPLIKKMKMESAFEIVVLVTGQHKEMLYQVLNIFDIVPEYDLEVMKNSQTLFDITCNVISSMNSMLDEIKPSLVLVHGDTSTTFAVALAAFYKQIPVGHVEAGLRTYNNMSPFPEEFNRQATSSIATLHFAPTNISKENLLKESKKESSIFVTGNTAIDALKYTINDNYNHEVITWCGDSKLILLTAHRRENLGNPMRSMFKAIKKIVDEHNDIKVVYPVHLNPKVVEIASEVLGNHDRIKLINPLDVVDFHNILNKSYIILTDSGGVQEEAPSLGKPVLVLRDTTERPEGVQAGTLKLVGTDEKIIYSEIKALLTDSSIYNSMSTASNPYGDGTASEKIVSAIHQFFLNRDEQE